MVTARRSEPQAAEPHYVEAAAAWGGAAVQPFKAAVEPEGTAAGGRSPLRSPPADAGMAPAPDLFEWAKILATASREPRVLPLPPLQRPSQDGRRGRAAARVANCGPVSANLQHRAAANDTNPMKTIAATASHAMCLPHAIRSFTPVL